VDFPQHVTEAVFGFGPIPAELVTNLYVHVVPDVQASVNITFWFEGKLPPLSSCPAMIPVSVLVIVMSPHVKLVPIIRGIVPLQFVPRFIGPVAEFLIIACALFPPMQD
jgi:hypothetical protein